MRVCLQCGQSTDGLFCATDGMATIVSDRRPTSTELQPNTIFASRYRVMGVLGRGGMGAVYEAQHTGTGQRVAIKTLLIDTAVEPQAARRFFNEAKLTAGLQHHNTIRVFDFGQSDEGIFFLVMERLQGESLTERIQRYAAENKKMSEAEAASIAVGILRSLAEAHRAGLVHRDMKPGNVFLHDIGGGETVVKVLDFGIAKSESHLTQTGTSLGTPSYMSPEQVMGQAIDGRSDLYSLGVVLYQCVAGSVPFPGESSYTVMMKQVHEPAPNLAELGSASPGFAHVVHKALAKKVEDRYESANAMREALEPFARGEQVSAPGSLYTEATIAAPSGSMPSVPPPPAGRAAGLHPPPPAPITKHVSSAPGAQRNPYPEPPPARGPRGFDAPAVPTAPKRANLLPLYVAGGFLIAGSVGAALWLHGGDKDKERSAAVAALAAAAPAALPAAVAPPTPAADVAPVAAPAPDAAVAADVQAPPEVAVAATPAPVADAGVATPEPDVAVAAAPDVTPQPDVAAAAPAADVAVGASAPSEPPAEVEPPKPVHKKPVVLWRHVNTGRPSPGTRPGSPGTRPSMPGSRPAPSGGRP